MSQAKARKMITGSEGNPDYLVIARENGYLLGIKPLLYVSKDMSRYGFRLRMQKAESNLDITNEKADAEGMLEVFKDVPWVKRSSTRFSTILVAEVPFGIEYPSNVREQIEAGVGALFAEVTSKLGEVVVPDTYDVLAFLKERYYQDLDQYVLTYSNWKAAQNGSDSDLGKGATVVQLFPSE